MRARSRRGTTPAVALEGHERALRKNVRLCRRLLLQPLLLSDTPTLTLIGSPSPTGWNWPFKQGPYCTGSSFDDLGPVLASFIQLPHAVQHAGGALYPPVLRPETDSPLTDVLGKQQKPLLPQVFRPSDFSYVYVLIPEIGRNGPRGKGLALPLCPNVVRFDRGEKKRACARLRCFEVVVVRRIHLKEWSAVVLPADFMESESGEGIACRQRGAGNYRVRL